MSRSLDLRTPGRASVPHSQLARADLARRLARLALPPEAVPRVLRLLEAEVEAAVADRTRHCFTADELRAAGGEELLETLRTQRREREQVEAIRAAGLADLSAEELNAVLAEARGAERS